MSNHVENDKESSLTAPSDRNREKLWKPEQGVPPLTEEEVNNAMNSLNDTSFVNKFPRVDRTYADPAISLQNIALLSFVPAKGATPNKKGVFGFAKIRGCYENDIEASQRAEFLIRNVDSFHKIYHTYVGRPFPITLSSEYSAETSEIDIRRETTNAISSDIKQKKLEEQKTVNDMKDREKKLLDESKRNQEANDANEIIEADPYDEYVTQCVKRAQLSWTFLEHLKKLTEIREIIINTRNKLDEMDKENSEYKEKYFKKYLEAREKSGLTDDIREDQDNFIKYMVRDAVIPTIDTDEVLPKLHMKEE